MNIKNLFNSKKNAKSTDESSAPVNWLGFTGKPGTIGSHTIGYPVTRESLKNPKVRDTDILFKESLEELKARDLLTDATGRPDNAENPENSSYKSQLNDYVSEIEKIAAQLTMSQSDGYSHILRICDAMKRELTVSAEMEDDL